MSKVIATQVTVTKIVLELDVEEAQGLQALLWKGVDSGTLDELQLADLAHALTECGQLDQLSDLYFVEGAQL
jgi:hypothetical protein